MSNLLVTGGLGFIGSEFVIQALSDDRVKKLTIIDKLTYAGKLTNLEPHLNNPKLKISINDIVDKSSIKSLFDNADIVVNFAAESHVDNSLTGIEPFLTTNILGTANLLEMARNANIVKFIQISTDEVYGSIENGSFTEESKLNPRNPYSASKAAAENLCNAYIETYKLPVIITRSSNNYGPRQQNEKFIPNAISNLLKNQPIKVYGEGMQQREWIHVSDNAKAILEIVFSSIENGIYNIGSGIHSTNLNLAKKLIEIANLDPEKYVEFVPDRLGHDFRYSIDSSKLHRHIGWIPKIEFEVGLQSTFEWYKQNG